MISRNTLAAVLALGIATPALAQVDVDVNKPGADVNVRTPGPELDVNVGAKAAPTDAWVDRPVYSDDGKHLGEVAAVAGDNLYVDIGGFLGIGETRVLISNAQIKGVSPDRIDLSLTEKEAKALPAADTQTVAPKN